MSVPDDDALPGITGNVFFTPRTVLLPLCLGSLLHSGYRVYTLNHGLQVPLVHWLNDPTLYPGDPFVAALGGYASLFWYAVAAGARVLPLEDLLAALFVVERVFVILAAGRLARSFAPGSPLAQVGAMALFALGLEPVIAHGTIVINSVEQTGFFIPFFLYAAAYFYERRPLPWALATAAAFNMNSLYGVYALSFFAAAALVDPPSGRQEAIRWAGAAALLAVLSLPALWLSLPDFGHAASNEALWLHATRVRVPHHLYPLLWDRRDLLLFALLATAAYGFFFAQRRRRERLARHTFAWTAIAAAWLVLAFQAAYVLESPGLLVLQPGRATDLWTCLAAVALTAVSAAEIETSRTPEGKGVWLLALLATLVVWHPLEKLHVLWILPVALVLWPLRARLLGERSPARLVPVLGLSVLALGLLGFAERVEQEGLRRALVHRPWRTEREVARWAAENTPPETTFLVDPLWDEFRALSQRPAFVTWKDGSAILWDRPFVSVWASRLREMGLDLRDPKLDYDKAIRRLSRAYGGIDDATAERLGKQYSLGFWIVPGVHPSALPVVFRNRDFKVLALSGPAS